jgi:xanthine dehydrogenase large subunit
LIEDVGKSLNPLVDLGQVEGSLIMGMGWWTTEEIINHPRTGKLLTKNSWVIYININIMILIYD